MTDVRQRLMSLTGTELVGVYNGLNPDRPLSSWKGRKGDLVDRVVSLRENGLALSVMDAVAAGDVPPDLRHSSADVEDDTRSETAESTTAEGAGPGATGNEAQRTIRSAAIEHLCHVDYFEDRGKRPGPDNVVDRTAKGARSVGIAYDRVLELIHSEFPDCETSAACLRWYSVKIRVEEHGYEGLTLPQRRPRVKPRRR